MAIHLCVMLHYKYIKKRRLPVRVLNQSKQLNDDSNVNYCVNISFYLFCLRFINSSCESGTDIPQFTVLLKSLPLNTKTIIEKFK